MTMDRSAVRDILSRDLLDFFVRLGLLALAVVACERVFAPFLPLLLWALILAVCFYPLCVGLQARTSWSPGRSASLLVLLLMIIIGVPTVMLGASFATHVIDIVSDLRAGQLTVEAPAESVRDWPVVGAKVYDAWSAAASDLPATIKQYEPQLASFMRSLLSTAASTAGTLFFFLAALVVAGIMMAYGSNGSAVLGRIFTRVLGPEKGPNLHHLSTMTVRSVALGVVGVAFIQALLLGVGFLLADIPAAGVLALIVLVIGILQLPALVVSLPAIGYIWGVGDGGTVMNSILSVYLLVAGAADGVLKPMLLGRGLDVPMPIVLIGALGGMVTYGIVGLFIGAVILSVGYELFMGWLALGEEQNVAEDAPAQR